MIKLSTLLKEILNENVSQIIIDNFEQGLMVYIMDAYIRLDDDKAELVEINDIYDFINGYAKHMVDGSEDEVEGMEFFLINRSQIEHYLIDNINEPIKVQWPGLIDVFYYTSFVKKNQIWIKLGTTPDSKLNSKYDYYNPSEDVNFPIRIRNKEDFEKYSKKLEAEGYYFHDGIPPSSYNPVEHFKGLEYPFKLVALAAYGGVDKNSKQLGFTI
jgi:hypothetical protein